MGIYNLEISLELYNRLISLPDKYLKMVEKATNSKIIKLMTKLTINGKTIKTTDFKLIEATILDEIRSWNNFEPEKGMTITVEKVPDVDALSVEATETVKSADLFGRQ